MFYEYALEPTVLSSWDRTRFFLDSFGPWKGRFLAEYPRRWKRMVFDGLTCPDVEKKRIVERLAALDKRVFSPRVNAAYDGTRTWLENAETEHQKRAFRAIVAMASEREHVVNGAEVDDECPIWKVDVGRLVSRDPAIFVQALALLFEGSKRIVVIDPYFRADLDEKTRPLVALCLALAGRSVSIEVHFADEPRGCLLCMKDARRSLPNILPTGAKVTLYCWKEKLGGSRLHNRYILTDIGGVQFGDGIEVGAPGQEDRLSLLDEPSRLKLWAQYLGSPPGFDAAGVPEEFVGRGARGGS